MIDLLVKVLINAAAVYVAIALVPQIKFPAADHLLSLTDDWWKLLAVALILALINSYVRPILRALSFPITLLSMGLFTFILNALLLLLVAFVSDQFKLGFTIGGFPPDLTADAFVGALLGSIVISIVSLILGMANRGRRLIG
ncbi:MAG TPA: phage holin family protein [Candidatus Limnocylindrales bacterium]|nr:phage holin family protein [Candidatus Limnocylindrales bacterium]